MKRKVIIILTLIFIMFLVGMSASASEDLDPRDARNIPPQLMETVNEDDTTMLIRYYNIGVRFAFNDCDNIDDVLAYRENWDLFFQKTNDEVFFYELDYEGNFHKHDGWVVNFSRKALEEFRTGEALKSISSDIILKRVFYISGENSHMGTAIYYQTNLGDYVYYHHYSVGELCFPAEAFFEYQKAMYEENRTYEERKEWDLSAYDYRSPDFNPNAPFSAPSDVDPFLLWGSIGAGVVLLAGVTVFYMLKKKRTLCQ